MDLSVATCIISELGREGWHFEKFFCPSKYSGRMAITFFGIAVAFPVPIDKHL